MTDRRFSILLMLGFYTLVMSGVTAFHAFNFSEYIHRKGDETINFTLFLLGSSLVFEGVVWIIAKRFDWTFILASIGNFIISYILGFAILMVAELGGTPKELIFLYGGCFITLFGIITFFQSSRLDAKSNA